MQVDLELYRQEIYPSSAPLIRLSAIDIAADQPRRTLVFIHGFGGKATQWRYQLQHFSDEYRVIAPDARGHGLSGKPRSGYSMPELTADLLAILDGLGVNDPIVLVGHSFGGAIAAEFALAYPQRLSHLVLVATAGEFRLNPLYRLLLKFPTTLLNFFAPFTRRWLAAPPHALKEIYTHSLAGWRGWSLFRRLQTPTLVIRGHLDVVFEKPMFEEVTRAIPGAEEVDVGASGHMVMLERRAALNRAIERFIETEQRQYSQSAVHASQARRTQLVKERPWLPFYEEGIAYTIAIPRIPLQALLQSATRRFPRHTALIFEGQRMSYDQLNRQVNRFAQALQALGVKKGERVMLVLPNLPQMVISFFGALKAGAVAVFSLPGTEPDEIVRQARDSGARIVVSLKQFEELNQQLKKYLLVGQGELRQVILADVSEFLPPLKHLALRLSKPGSTGQLTPGQSFHAFNQLLAGQSDEEPEVKIEPAELAVIQYTGGTTDRPKGVMLSHYNLVANALQTRHWIPNAQEGREVFLCALPFAHSYGLTAALNAPISLGATLILKARFEARDILQAIQRYRPTIFPGVPQMYVALKDFPGVRKYGISSIKACISGSAPLPVEVQEAFEKLTRGRLVEGYGLTEASPVTHSNPLAGLRKVGSIGIPLPSTLARVVDLKHSNQEAPPGQIGELAVQGPQVMLGYWKNPAATRRVLLPGGWLLTGDVAQMDSDGYFRIIARKADMWYPDKPGNPAFPRDVEEVLFEIPQVKEAAVVAIARQPIAFVITRKERPNPESLLAYCQRRLPPELVPRLVIYLDEFPRTFIGKVLRRELARYFRENHRHLLAQDIIDDQRGLG